MRYCLNLPVFILVAFTIHLHVLEREASHRSNFVAVLVEHDESTFSHCIFVIQVEMLQVDNVVEGHHGSWIHHCGARLDTSLWIHLGVREICCRARPFRHGGFEEWIALAEAKLAVVRMQRHEVCRRSVSTSAGRFHESTKLFVFVVFGLMLRQNDSFSNRHLTRSIPLQSGVCMKDC